MYDFVGVHACVNSWVSSSFLLHIKFIYVQCMHETWRLFYAISDSVLFCFVFFSKCSHEGI